MADILLWVEKPQPGHAYAGLSCIRIQFYCKTPREATVSSNTFAEDLGSCLNGVFSMHSCLKGRKASVSPAPTSRGGNIFPAAGDRESGSTVQLLVTAAFCWSCTKRAEPVCLHLSIETGQTKGWDAAQHLCTAGAPHSLL